MRSLGWALIQCHWCPSKKERDTKGAYVQGKDQWGHSEKVVIQKPKGETSEEIKPADTLILDFQIPELRENKLQLFKPPSFVAV